MLISIAMAVAGVALLFMIAASIYDLKDGEIPDEINYGFFLTLVVIGICLSISRSNTNLIVNSIYLGIAYFAAAYLLYRLGQWGGGDVKLLLGVGCTLGLLNSLGFAWDTPLMPYYVAYFINMGFIAMPYALAYMLLLRLSNKNVFQKFS
jgi:Flp pilus assembly protein protease CpaA